MKINCLYANWEAYGEQASTPRTWVDELMYQGHEVSIYNLYHGNGFKNPRTNRHHYSNEGFNMMHQDIQRGKECDVIFLMDYAPYQNLNLNKKIFPNQILVKESGDEPQSHRMHLQTAKQFDIVLSPDKQCVEHYKSLDINAHWQPHFADHVFYPRDYIKSTAKVATSCGSRGNGLTEKLKKEFGGDFINERVCNGDEHAELLSGGKIVFHKSQYGEIGRRIFEGMSLNRMVLTDRLDSAIGLNDLFEENKEIVYYSTAEEAIEKINYYSMHDEERERIALNGYIKVMQNHTVTHRVNQLVKLIEEVKK